MNQTTLPFLKLLGHVASGGVSELCVFEGKTPAHIGYFDDHSEALAEIARFDGKANVFVTVNPCKRDLLARAHNRLKKCGYKDSERTKDQEILRDCWLFIDIDPRRPSGISSTDVELAAAVEVGRAVLDWLISIGIPASSIVTARSGNGVYLLVRLPDYEVTKERTEIKKAFLNYLGDLFDTEQVEIDRSVFNPARLVCALGTMKVKGENIPERPHRLSAIGSIGGVRFNPGVNQTVAPFDLYALASSILPKQVAPERKQQQAKDGRSAFDIREHTDKLHNEKNSSRGYAYFDCPVCGGAQKLHINESNGAYACFHKECTSAAIREAMGLSRHQLHINANGRMQHDSFPARQVEGAGNESQGDEWEAPAYFNEYNLPVFPVDALPDWLAAFVMGLATETQTPVDLCAMLVLSACAAAVAGKVRIQARQGWQEPLNLYTVTALPPGNRKSAVFSECLKPLEEVEAALIEQLRDEIAQAASEYRILEQRRDKAEREAAKADNINDRMKAEREAVDLAQKLAAQSIPTMPKLLADDATPEAIATMLFEQKGRLAVLSPEGDLFDIMAGRYSSGAPNFAVLLKGHAGDDLRVDRRNRAEFVKQPALTVGLAVQPDVIRGLVEKPGFRGRGLIGRFLFSLPVSRLGTRKARATPMEEEARREYFQRVKKLAALESALDADGKPTARMLYLTSDADDYLCQFQDEIEPQLCDAGELATMTDWAGKLPGAVLRIAGILHLAEYSFRTNFAHQISAETIKCAIQIGQYLIPHAKAAYAEMGADEQIERAKYVLRWIEKAGVQSFTKRDAHQANKGRFKKVTDIEPALDLLESHNFIRPQKSGDDGKRGRKPSQVYEVNPLLNVQSHNSHNSHNTPDTLISEHSEHSENRGREVIEI